MSSFDIEGITGGPFMTNAYLVADHETKKCAVIDPGCDADRVWGEVIAHKGLTLDSILCTHGHIDHVCGVAAMHRAIMAQVRSLPKPGARKPGRQIASAMAAAALFLLGVGLTTLPQRPGASLLRRPPVEVGRPATAEEPSSLTVTVGHEPWQGLMGRRKALAELRLAFEVRRSGRRH